MTFTEVTGLDINDSDKVYKTEDGTRVKIRVLRRNPDPQADPEQHRNMMILKISASICDEYGKALPDPDLGWKIAPAQTYTINLQGLIDAGKDLMQEVEKYRLEQAEQAISFKQVLDQSKLFIVEE